MENLRYKHVKNIRDLVGIQGADGKHVIEGRLIRGGHLNELSEKDAECFKQMLGLSLVIDLRSPSETEEKPDVIADGVDYIYLPSLTNEQNPSINSKNRTAELTRIMAQEGGAIGHLSRLYRAMITQEMAIKSHRELLLNLIEKKQGAIYWHCTQGKDRTGVAAAVILMALGVSREDIIKEYLNEKRSLKARNNVLTALAALALRKRSVKRNLYTLMSARRECMEAALDEVDSFWGGPDKFIHEGLGITDEQIDTLRSMYLV